MKRLCLLLLALLLLLGAAQAEQPEQAEALPLAEQPLQEETTPEPEPAAGVWVLAEQRLPLTETGYALLESPEMTIVLHEDGTAWGDNGRRESDGTWTQEEARVTIIIDGSALCFTVTEGQLVSEPLNGVVMVLKRGYIGEVIDPEAIVGEWALTSAIFEGEEMDTAALTAGEMKMILTLYPDGSAWGDNGSSQMGGRWEAEGDLLHVTIDDDTLAFRLVEGQLIGDEVDSVVMFLSKTDTVLAPASDVAGEWQMTSARMEGEVLDAEALEKADKQMHITLFENGSAWGDNGFNQVGGSWAASGDRVTVSIGTDALAFTLIDGQLVGDENGGTVVYLSRVVDEGPEGFWRLASMTSGGQTAEGDMLTVLGIVLTFELREDGTAWGDNGTNPAEGTWTEADGLLTVTIDGDDMTFRLREGMLVTEGDSVTMTFTRDEDQE